MTPLDKAIISEWGSNVDGDIALTLVLNNTEQGRQMQAFCEELAQYVPSVQVKNESDNDQPFPEIRINQNIHFRAVPLENELRPFLQALHNHDKPDGPFPESIRDKLSQINLPAFIKIYVSPQCPFCPKVVEECIALARANPFINVIIIDGVLFPDLAGKDKIFSVPAVILDDQFRWIGKIQIADLVNMIVDRDPAMLSVDSLIQMIQDSRAADLAKMMVDRGKVFPAFLELLVHEKWSIRLGAMVTFEHLVEENKVLSSQIIASLWDRFPDLDDPIKGDVIYLLGESNDAAVIPMLQSIISGDYPPDLKEATKEALETLESTNQ